MKKVEKLIVNKRRIRARRKRVRKKDGGDASLNDGLASTYFWELL
jgi:hypothetical protein